MSPSLGPPLELSDDRLVEMFRDGELEALNLLLERYRRFARAKARGYFLVGADYDDIVQEGMIGLFKAVRDFRPEREASFRVFAELCITRQILTAIKAASRLKHRPLNQYVSLSGLRLVDEPGGSALEELLDDHHAPDPADEVVSWHETAAMQASMAEILSSLEVDVLRLYLEGNSYEQISARLGRHPKSVDNALQRIKRKLEAHLLCRGEDEVSAAVA